MSSKLEEIREFLDDETIILDGFDNCVIGIASRIGQPSVLAYDMGKCIEELMSQGMDNEEALEYFEYNVAGAYLGEYTPIFISS